MFAGEFVEAALVFGLVLGDAGVAGYQRVDRLGGRTDAREELVGFDMKVGGVQFGSYGLVDQLVDLVPAGEEVVDGVEERGGDLFVADVRGSHTGFHLRICGCTARCVFRIWCRHARFSTRTRPRTRRT